MANIAQLIAAYAGDPTNAPTSVFDAPLGAIVLDTTGGTPRVKNTGFGDNSAFTVLSDIMGTTQTNIPAGSTGVIPAGSQAIVFGTDVISGTLIIAGEVRFGAWPF